jgi:hypothetical protein
MNDRDDKRRPRPEYINARYGRYSGQSQLLRFRTSGGSAYIVELISKHVDVLAMVIEDMKTCNERLAGCHAKEEDREDDFIRC